MLSVHAQITVWKKFVEALDMFFNVAAGEYEQNKVKRGEGWTETRTGHTTNLKL